MATLPAPIWEPVDIVYGVYTLQGDFTGHDRWWIQRLVESDTGWMVHNDIFLDTPQKRYITLDVELSEEWDWLYLNLRDDRGNILSAEAEPGKLVVEQDNKLTEFPFDSAGELDYLSPFMNSLTLRRLQLRPGQSVTRPVVWFDALTFEPRLVEMTYTRQQDDTVDIAGMSLPVQRVRFQNHHSGYDTILVVREDGLVLHYPDHADLDPDQQASAGRGRMPPLAL
jgi:hypothetical protein